VKFKDWYEKNKEKLQSLESLAALELAWSEGQAALADWLDALNKAANDPKT
jgi:hypothetical protein